MQRLHHIVGGGYDDVLVLHGCHGARKVFLLHRAVTHNHNLVQSLHVGLHLGQSSCLHLRVFIARIGQGEHCAGLHAQLVVAVYVGHRGRSVGRPDGHADKRFAVLIYYSALHYILLLLQRRGLRGRRHSGRHGHSAQHAKQGHSAQCAKHVLVIMLFARLFPHKNYL